MDLSHDFRDLLAAFAKVGVRYLLIGGHAVAVHSKPRYTKDIDLWIDGSKQNAQSVAHALGEFGAPQSAIDDIMACREDEIVWFGNPPGRVDLLKAIPGVTFSAAYANRVIVEIGGTQISVISIEDLIAAKIAAGRPQDEIDVTVLRATQGD